MRIRPLQTTDLSSAFSVWEAALGPEWPLDPVTFAAVVGEPRYHLVAERGDRCAGFALVHGERAALSLVALVVRPEDQRQGVGTRLVETVLADAHGRGDARLRLGAGRPRLWPGVPYALPGAIAFFGSHGATFGDDVFDLLRSLDDFVDDARRPEDVTIGLSRPAEAEEVLAFEAREFPNWVPAVREAFELGNHDDVVVARSRHDHRVIGALVLCSARSHPQRQDRVWLRLLGRDHGTINEVGVAPDARNRRVGVAMVGYGSTQLRDRGATSCLIGWTTRLNFYGRLGYLPWQRYAAGSLEVNL